MCIIPLAITFLPSIIQILWYLLDYFILSYFIKTTPTNINTNNEVFYRNPHDGQLYYFIDDTEDDLWGELLYWGISLGLIAFCYYIAKR